MNNFFKNVTWAMPVIMGRKTLNHWANQLTGRTNIVITRKTDWKKMDYCCSKLDKCYQTAAEYRCK
jgi:dihydrofolate reductase